MVYFNEEQACTDTILDTLRELRGVSLWGYRIGTLMPYIYERIAALGLESYDDYAGYLRQNYAECDALLHMLLISASSFFREGLTFSILAEAVLPCLLEVKCKGQGELRIWSAGCSAGEEIYSLAILLRELLQLSGKKLQFFLLGTDINQSTLDQARLGRYSRDSLKYVPLRFVDTYFEEHEQYFEVSPDIRAMVHFCNDDILDDTHVVPVDSIFGSFDLILCRNLLLYYDIERQQEIAVKLENCLNRKGYLILGDSESLAGPVISKFSPVMGRQFVLQKN